MAPTRQRLELFAAMISVLSIVYNAAEGGISIGFGAESSSRSLALFGAQSFIEVLSAAIVCWRFRHLIRPFAFSQHSNSAEMQTLDPVLDARVLRFERLASYAIGSLLALLAMTSTGICISILALREHPDSSLLPLVVAGSALGCMLLIWMPKPYLARHLNSSVMHGEAKCSLSCIQITSALFIGALVYRFQPKLWWADGATGLVLSCLFGFEAYKTITWASSAQFNGGCCKSCNTNQPGGSSFPADENRTLASAGQPQDRELTSPVSTCGDIQNNMIPLDRLGCGACSAPRSGVRDCSVMSMPALQAQIMA